MYYGHGTCAMYYGHGTCAMAILHESWPQYMSYGHSTCLVAIVHGSVYMYPTRLSFDEIEGVEVGAKPYKKAWESMRKHGGVREG